MGRARILSRRFAHRTVRPLRRLMRYIRMMSPFVSCHITAWFVTVLMRRCCAHRLPMVRLFPMVVVTCVPHDRMNLAARDHRRAQIISTMEDLPTPVAMSVEVPATSAVGVRHPDIGVSAKVHDVTIGRGSDIDIVALGHQFFPHDRLRRCDRRTGPRRRSHHCGCTYRLRCDSPFSGGHASPQRECARDSGDG